MFQQLREDFQDHGVKLAAAVAATFGVLVENQEILLAVIALIPADPMQRLLLALGVAGATFAAPYIAVKKRPPAEAVDASE